VGDVTNAPADLLGLRSKLQQLTGLSPVDVGIVGDAAHARSGGYHIGRTGLREAGVWDSDYSVRLTRDRTGATESASAMDVGCNWRQGRAVWIRWNNLLANALRAGEVGLMTVRAINYSPDGKLRWRIDRQSAFRTESSSDTVDIHTHIEWYRDTEGQRQACLDRIAALAQQAITGQLAPQEDDVSAHLEAVMDAWRSGVKQASDGSFVAPVDWRTRDEAWQASITASLAADATRDAAQLAAIQALASAGGVDSAPIVAAVTAVRDEAREQFAALHDQLAAETSARQAAEARAAELERALADALGKAAGQ
jgi:hypothetical protein